MNNRSWGFGRSPRSRLRKRKKGAASFHYGIPRKFTSLRVKHSPSSSRGQYKYRGEGPLHGGLDKAWVGYVIARNQDDYEKMRKYAIAIQRFERLLNIEINEFPQLGLYTSDALENVVEDDDSTLRIVDPLADDGREDQNDESY
jgi:hypothetical protein